MHNINPLKTQLNPICHFLALLGAHHILHVSRIRVKEKKILELERENARLQFSGELLEQDMYLSPDKLLSK